MVEPGQVLDGRYRLDARIATGGMGEVWRGTDLALNRAVAVKLLRPEQASQADGLARFRAEAQHAGSLSHPNIAQVYDYFEPAPPEPAYLVLELVHGPSLACQLDSGPISPERTLDVIEQAASGLAAAHRSGLLHRDIKPGNLLLNRGRAHQDHGFRDRPAGRLGRADPDRRAGRDARLPGPGAGHRCPGDTRGRYLCARRRRAPVPDRAGSVRWRAAGGSAGPRRAGHAAAATLGAARPGRPGRRPHPQRPARQAGLGHRGAGPGLAGACRPAQHAGHRPRNQFNRN